MFYLYVGVIKDFIGSLDDGFIDRMVFGFFIYYFYVEFFKYVIYCFVVGVGFEGGDLVIEVVINMVQIFYNVLGIGQEVDSEVGFYFLGWVINYGGIGWVVCDVLVFGGSIFYKFVKGIVFV